MGFVRLWEGNSGSLGIYRSLGRLFISKLASRDDSCRMKRTESDCDVLMTHVLRSLTLSRYEISWNLTSLRMPFYPLSAVKIRGSA